MTIWLLVGHPGLFVEFLSRKSTLRVEPYDGKSVGKNFVVAVQSKHFRVELVLAPLGFLPNYRFQEVGLTDVVALLGK